MEIYKPSTEVKLTHIPHMTAIVDKVIIGDNEVIQYQLIVYIPHRDQMVVNSSEIEGFASSSKINELGFCVDANKLPEVAIVVDSDNKFINYSSTGKVVVDVIIPTI